MMGYSDGAVFSILLEWANCRPEYSGRVEMFMCDVGAGGWSSFIEIYAQTRIEAQNSQGSESKANSEIGSYHLNEMLIKNYMLFPTLLLFQRWNYILFYFCVL